MDEKSWDDLAETWDTEEGTQDYSREVLKELKELFPNLHKSVVLDFGCGTGILTQKLIGIVEKVVAVDLSSKMIDKVKEKFENIEAHAIDICQSPEILVINRFDLIVASSVLRFAEDLPTTMSSLVNCLTENGHFVQFDWPNEIENDENCQNGFNTVIVDKLYDRVGLEVKETKTTIFSMNPAPAKVFIAVGKKITKP